MTKFISGIFALFLLAFASTADAGWNLRQNDDGTTDWVRDGTDTTQDAHPIGSVYLNVLISDISTAATFVVVSPIDNAEVSYIQSVIANQITGTDAVLTFRVLASGATDGGITTANEITNATGRMTVTACVDSTCTEDGGTVDTFTPTGRNAIEKGEVILINTNGASTNAVGTMLTITIVPR